MLSGKLHYRCAMKHISPCADIYRPHPRDGEGNSFSLFVSSHLRGEGVPTLDRGGGGKYLGWWMGGTYLG